MLIGVFNFYAHWLPLFEIRLTPWRRILAQQPPSGGARACRQQDSHLLATLWSAECLALLLALKTEILEGPVLARPDSSRRSYLKFDWCKDGMGAALLQAE